MEIENFDLNIDESGRNFGPLRVQKKNLNYKGIIKPKEKEKPDKKKYNYNETILDSNDALEYEAEYKRKDWSKNSHPMSGRPFTLEKKHKPNLYTKNVERITLRQSYKPKDWNKIIKQRNEIKINMPIRKKRQTITKQRAQPIIIKGKGKEKGNWNDVIQKQDDSKVQIGKSIKKYNFLLSKENDLYIENETDEILVNDDYNIVEENYARPVRAYIRKVDDYTEESVSSDYDILNQIHRHEDQFNQFRELVNESMKINGQRVIINDISGKYPRKVEIFQGLDENFEKLANDQKNHRRFSQRVTINVTKDVTRNIEQSGYTQRFDGERSMGYFTSKRIVQKQINDEPIQQREYYVESNYPISGGQVQRRLGFRSDYDNNLQSRIREMRNKEFYDNDNMNIRQGYYYKGINASTSRGRLNRELDEEPEDEDVYYRERERERIGEREREIVQTRNQIIVNPQNSTRYTYRRQIINEQNEDKIGGFGSPRNQPEIGTKIAIQQEYYLNKNRGERVLDNIENEIDLMRQNQQQINLIDKKGGSVKQSPRILGSPIGNSQQFKEVAFTPNENRLKNITLKKREDQDEEEPQDGMSQNVNSNKKTINQDIQYQQQIRIGTKVNEQQESEQNEKQILMEKNKEIRQSERDQEQEEGYEEGYEEEHQGEEYENENDEEEEHHHEEFQVEQGEIKGEYVPQEIEGEEDIQQHEEENEQEQGEEQIQNKENEKDINNDDEELGKRVSAVEEITGQNINIQNSSQAQNIQTINQMYSSNINQSNSSNKNQNVLRAKISRPKITSDNNNEINIERQEFNQNEVRNAQNVQNIGSRMEINSSQYSTGKNITASNVISNSSRITAEFGGGEIIKNDAQYGRIEMTVNKKEISSPNKESADINSKENVDEEDEKK